MAVPKKVATRLVAAMKTLRPIIEQQKARDVSEADTVTIVKDLLSEAFGYDKYAELTGEFAIRGTYCDLAIRVDDRTTQLIEVKAIGITLDDRHLKQAVNYAANEGIEWVVLTNGINWRLYNVIFAKPIDKRLILDVNLLTLDPRREEDLELMYVFCKEGFVKGVHEVLRDRQVATSRYLIAALLLQNDAVLNRIRRELRRVVEINVDEAEIVKVLRDEVIKRDALEDPEADKAAQQIKQGQSRSLVKKRRPRADVARKIESDDTRDANTLADDVTPETRADP